jgi:hypothetical protein
MTPVAKMVGSNRIVTGHGIVHPLGDAEAGPETEHAIRRRILENALAMLTQPAGQGRESGPE